MSPRASEGAVSPETSPTTLTKQQQTVAPSGTAEDQQQTEAPCSAIEDQLKKEVAGLEAEIRQLKRNQDPAREGVRHTLVQEELAQIRETNLNLRVELQVAQKGHRVLEEKYHALVRQHERCIEFVQKAVENLSTGLELSNRDSTNVVASGFPTGTQSKKENHPWALPTDSAAKGSSANIFGQPSIRTPVEQPFSSTPGPFQNNRTRLSTSPFPSSCLAPSQFLAKITKPAAPVFGISKEIIHGWWGNPLRKWSRYWEISTTKYQRRK